MHVCMYIYIYICMYDIGERWLLMLRLRFHFG